MLNVARFETTLLSVDGRNTGIEVPASVIETWNVGKRPPVIVDVNGFVYRSTVASMGGRFLLPFSADKRKATGLAADDPISVTLTHDIVERTVEVPDDLAAALASAGLRERFDALAYSHRKEHVRAVEDAKKPETRARRIEACVEKLSA